MSNNRYHDLEPLDLDVDTSRPTAVFQPTPNGRPWTLSVAIPSSVISNSKRKLDLRTQLAGNIARALSVFCVDEVVIFDDGDHPSNTDPAAHQGLQQPVPIHPKSTKCTAFIHPSHFLSFLLSYLETPPFMRSRLWPVHENLAKAGILASLDMPHHLRSDEYCSYREAITLEYDRERGGTWVDCGEQPHPHRFVRGIEEAANTRLTVRMPSQDHHVNEDDEDTLLVDAVLFSEPREEGGYYWGYEIREAQNLSSVFTECQYEGGYDLSVGTSERGQPVRSAVNQMKKTGMAQTWQHLVVVFGGVSGLETAAFNDENLEHAGIGKSNTGELFDYWVNLVPGQGSRTIRTEEALWIGLTALRGIIEDR